MRKTYLVAALITLLLGGCGGGINESLDSPASQRVAMASPPLAAPGAALPLPESRDHYTIQSSTSGYLIKNTKTGTSQNVSATTTRLQFADVSVALDIDNAGRIYRLYQAAFNRIPDLAGLGYWLQLVDRGMPLIDVAASFMQSNEFRKLLGDNPTDQEFLTKIYNNVLHRAPDDAGLNYWLDILKKGASRPQVLLSFSESAENVAQAEIAIKDGVEYAQPDIAYRPAANAGSNQQATAGTLVTIDGSDSSDANGDALNFAWSLSKPLGSLSTIPTANKSILTFTPDVAGTYTATLIVNDGKLYSDPYIVTIIVAPATVTPIADTGRFTCSSITHAYAVELYNQGHTYLDRDHDGKPCEATDILIEKPASTPITTPSTGMCWVNGYYRKNGTYVKGYWRRC